MNTGQPSGKKPTDGVGERMANQQEPNHIRGVESRIRAVAGPCCDNHRIGLVKSRSERSRTLSVLPTRNQRHAYGSSSMRCAPSLNALLCWPSNTSTRTLPRADSTLTLTFCALLLKL